MFLTHAEVSLIMEGMGERYKAFTNFLVMTSTRFGEATALTVADVDLLSKPPTARRSACSRKARPAGPFGCQGKFDTGFCARYHCAGGPRPAQAADRITASGHIAHTHSIGHYSASCCA
jgi:hypothetical protein